MYNMPSTRRNRNRSRRSKSCKNINLKFEQNIVMKFLEVLNTVKLYHWKTHSYPTHKATDELYDKLNGNIDEFVEVLLGKDESRIKLLKKRVDLLDTTNAQDFKTKIYKYRDYLIEMNEIFDAKEDTDLLSIRDEMLSNINQFLYLLTFK